MAEEKIEEKKNETLEETPQGVEAVQAPEEGAAESKEESADPQSAQEPVSAEATEPEEQPREHGAEAPAPAPVEESDKNRLAQKKVAAAREKVLGADEEVEECLRRIEEDLERFERYEKEELLPVILKSRHILEEIGAEELPQPEELLPELELTDAQEERMRIEDISSGKGGAFFWSLIGGVGALLGWYLFAATKAGVALVPQQLPDLPFLSGLAAKIADQFGQGHNPAVGTAIVVVTTLLVMWLIYTVIVSVRASRNIRHAEQVEEEAGFYCRKKEECKQKMEEVREHLRSMDRTVQKYEVILAEQNAILRRALHVEEPKGFDDLHEKTKATVRELQSTLSELEALLSTPMAQSGMLTPESVEALRRAKRLINDHILRLYS